MTGTIGGWRGWLAGLAVVCAAAGAWAQPDAGVPERTLRVGDKAPPLKVAQWVRGEPVEEFKAGRVYAIEFWATWCGPCVAGIPHLAEVQKEFKDGVDVVGLTTEDPGNTLEKVTKFVASREDMQYRVAFDDLDKTWRAYMEAAGQNGIPCAFIIDKQGRVAWIGHPAMPEFEKTIGAIVKDEFDLEKAEREGKAAAEAQEKIRKDQEELHKAWEAGDTEKAFTLADEIIASDPGSMRQWAWWKFESLMIGVEQPERAYAFVREMMAGPYKEDADMLLRFAYGIGDSLGIEHKDLDLALDLAERSVTLTMGQDSQKLAGLAMVRMSRQEYDEAIAVMERAIEVAPNDQMKAYLQNELAFYKMDKEMAGDEDGG